MSEQTQQCKKALRHKTVVLKADIIEQL